MKWFLQSSARDCSADDVITWSPPRADENHGMSCRLTVTPTQREQAHAGGPRASWLLRVDIQQCVPMVARFHGEYVKARAQSGGQYDPQNAQLQTPFFVLRSEDGVVRRLSFFANETLRMRNFKRGMVAFLSVRDIPEGVVMAHDGRTHVGAPWGDEAVASNDVDQDEAGVYVLAGTFATTSHPLAPQH